MNHVLTKLYTRPRPLCVDCFVRILRVIETHHSISISLNHRVRVEVTYVAFQLVLPLKRHFLIFFHVNSRRRNSPSVTSCWTEASNWGGACHRRPGRCQQTMPFKDYALLTRPISLQILKF